MLHPSCSAPKRGTHAAAPRPELSGITAGPQRRFGSSADRFPSAFSLFHRFPFPPPGSERWLGPNAECGATWWLQPALHSNAVNTQSSM